MCRASARSPASHLDQAGRRRCLKALHKAGCAHSVEVWDKSGNLAGALYGVALGKAFITESMFARQADASKVGFVTLSHYLKRWGFVLNDGKRDSSHLRSLGFRPIPRTEFNALLAQACAAPGKPGNWSVRQRPRCRAMGPEAGQPSRGRLTSLIEPSLSSSACPRTPLLSKEDCA